MGRLAVLAITSAASIILLVVLLVLMEALIVVLGGDVERERGHVSFLAVSPTGIMIIVHRYGVLVRVHVYPCDYSRKTGGRKALEENFDDQGRILWSCRTARSIPQLHVDTLLAPALPAFGNPT
jgi:hypothetical protein